jgi:hypothetical protein
MMSEKTTVNTGATAKSYVFASRCGAAMMPKDAALAEGLVQGDLLILECLRNERHLNGTVVEFDRQDPEDGMFVVRLPVEADGADKKSKKMIKVLPTNCRLADSKKCSHLLVLPKQESKQSFGKRTVLKPNTSRWLNRPLTSTFIGHRYTMDDFNIEKIYGLPNVTSCFDCIKRLFRSGLKQSFVVKVAWNGDGGRTTQDFALTLKWYSIGTYLRDFSVPIRTRNEAFTTGKQRT